VLILQGTQTTTQERDGVRSDGKAIDNGYAGRDRKDRGWNYRKIRASRVEERANVEQSKTGGSGKSRLEEPV
jgi:hypothetical protein